MPRQRPTAKFHIFLPALGIPLWVPHCTPVSAVANSGTPQCPGYMGPSQLLHLASLGGPLIIEWCSERYTDNMEEGPCRDLTVGD